MSESSKQPYLLRAMHEWMTDNDQTPHMVVDVSVPGVQVPMEHVQEGKIILNVSYAATTDLSMSNELVSFGARFGGVAQQIMFPASAVLGIYARETGQGMIFTDEVEFSGATPDAEASAMDSTEPDMPDPPGSGAPKSGKSHLRVVK
ncbi:MAG: ClpXP protease specificity-enhancing factor [Gammaproteobacteria bacterium]